MMLFVFPAVAGLLAAGYFIGAFKHGNGCNLTRPALWAPLPRGERKLLNFLGSPPAEGWSAVADRGGAPVGTDQRFCHAPLPLGCSNAWVNLEDYLSRRPALMPVGEIKGRIVSLLANDSVKGRYGLYFEDLQSGAWFGINETNLYNQWSLLKIKVAAIVLKKVERRELDLNDSVEVTPVELNTATLFPELNHAGDKLTVRELLERLIRYSDNTASFALSRFFSADEFQDTLLALGTLPAPADKPRNFLPPISPKEYANALRDLYFAKYLSKPACELMLALMADTVYDSQIRMGLPPGIKVAHKVGFNAGSGEFHDCGIVYFPAAPYILCVMSKDNTRDEADRVIRELSRQIYEFICSCPAPCGRVR